MDDDDGDYRYFLDNLALPMKITKRSRRIINRYQILLNNIDVWADYGRTVFIYVNWKTWTLYRTPGGKTGDKIVVVCRK